MPDEGAFRAAQMIEDLLLQLKEGDMVLTLISGIMLYLLCPYIYHSMLSICNYLYELHHQEFTYMVGGSPGVCGMLHP